MDERQGREIDGRQKMTLVMMNRDGVEIKICSTYVEVLL